MHPLQFCTIVHLLSCPDVWTLRRLQVPVIGFIGRLDYQKGADLVLGAAHWLLNQDVQIICLGTGDKHLEVKLIVITNSRLIAPHHYFIALLHTDEVHN
jgi:glycogen synthase